MTPPLLKRVQLQNYRSIARCDVRPGRLTFLVGRNGSGKSNFLDALRLTTDSLRTSLEHALRDRGGISEVRRRSKGGKGRPTDFAIRLDVQLPDTSFGFYAFKIAAIADGGYRVEREEAKLGSASFRVESGQVVQKSVAVAPPASADRLYLVSVAGLPEFRPLYDQLSRMSFLNPAPDVLRNPQPPDSGEYLARDGRNLVSVFDRICRDANARRIRIEEYLGKVVPGIRSVGIERALGLETLEFLQESANDQRRFRAMSMSDGTLRALGVLVALFRNGDAAGHQPPVVGLEEPEMALHPAAAGVLLDALEDASSERQILVTTHSPDLLDHERIGIDQLRAVVFEDDETRIGEIGKSGRAVLSEHLYTAGELLRLDQLSPDRDHLSARQRDLFDGE